MTEIVVGKADDIPEGTAKVVNAGGKEVAVFNQGGEFFAIDNNCPHRGGPLSEGFVDGGVVTCPLHSWQFDIRTGASVMNPDTKVKNYAVELRGDDVVLIFD